MMIVVFSLFLAGCVYSPASAGGEVEQSAGNVLVEPVLPIPVSINPDSIAGNVTAVDPLLVDGLNESIDLITEIG